MKMYFLRFCLCFFQIFCASAFARKTLHDLMTEAELAYYFETHDRDLIPDYEIVDLPVVLPNEADDIFGDLDEFEEIQYSFSAFERPLDLKLRPNPNLKSSNLKTYIHDENGVNILEYSPQNCHYLHEDGQIVASISICTPNNVQGLIFLDNTTLEVHPLNDRLHSLLRFKQPVVESLTDGDIRVPHIIKRANFKQFPHPNEAFPVRGNVWDENEFLQPTQYPNFYDRLWFGLAQPEAASIPAGGLTLELAVFFDEAAFKLFDRHFNGDDKKLHDMLLAYMNGVQALYHHPSLRTPLEIVIVRLHIMKSQPKDLPHYNGERSKLLDSFCSYQAKLNPEGDSNKQHWDMGLYISGLDFFAYENGRKSSVTMGLATVGGVCLDKYACVIAEFGTTNVFGKPYPSAGFTSVYITAHEIGHNLGMHHDSSGNSCPKEGYIMSPSRGTNGETQWSSCSADIMDKLGWAKCLHDSAVHPKSTDHTRFSEIPGQKYTAKRQCEVLLRDKDAVMLPHQELSTICYNLQCKTPHRSGYYFAGPALEGTQCGNGRYCFGGNCVKKALPKPVKVIPGGWSDWKEGTCSSGCIEKSMGNVVKRRSCNNPTPVNTDKGCAGPSIEFGLCKDQKVCKGKKQSVEDYASGKCKEFSTLLPELDSEGVGLQAPHEEARVWMGCTIFCRRADTKSFYTPRIELNDLGVSPYFPDGTWCHRENNINYYCIQHHCLPENFKLTKTSEVLEDLTFLQNARPSPVIPQDVKDYLSLGLDGKPIRTTLDTDSSKPKDDEWENKDYVELSDAQKHKFLDDDDNINDEFNYV